MPSVSVIDQFPVGKLMVAVSFHEVLASLLTTGNILDVPQIRADVEQHGCCRTLGVSVSFMLPLFVP